MRARRCSPGVVGLAVVAAAVLACGRNGSNRVSGVDNVPPLISTVLVSPMEGDAMVAWGGRARVTVEAVDPDGDGSRMTYAWKTTSGSPIGPNAKEAFYQHNRVVRDSDIVTVTVTDAVGGVSTKEATVRISSTGATTQPPATQPGVPGGENPSEECYETTSAPCLLVNGSRSPITVDPGERVTVTVPRGPGGAKDWVGLHLWTARHEDRLEKQYLNGSSATPPAAGLTTATLTFTMPTNTDDYTFRFFANDGVALLSASARVTVRRAAPNPTNPPPPTPTPRPDDPTPEPTPQPTGAPQPTATPQPTPTPVPTSTPTPVPAPGIGCPDTQSQGTGGGSWSGTAGIGATHATSCSVNCGNTPSCSNNGCDSVSFTSCTQSVAGGTNACFTVIEVFAHGPGGTASCSFIVEAKY